MIKDPEGITDLLARNNPSWGHPDRTRGECFTASARLLMVMGDRGLDGHLIRAEWSGAQPGNHFAVLLRGTVFDLTARQFDERLPFPLILPRAVWEAMLREVTIEGNQIEFLTEQT